MEKQELISEPVRRETLWQRQFTIGQLVEGSDASRKTLWQISWQELSGQKHKIVVETACGLEFATLVAGLGSGRITPTVESMEEYLTRGGVVQYLPTKFAQGGGSWQAGATKALPPWGKTSADKIKQAVDTDELMELLGLVVPSKSSRSEQEPQAQVTAINETTGAQDHDQA